MSSFYIGGAYCIHCLKASIASEITGFSKLKSFNLESLVSRSLADITERECDALVSHTKADQYY